eukprot:43097-Eustigmatos_ZCMA.PRE.1
MKCGKRTLPPALKAWNELVDKVIEKTGKGRGEAMKIAKVAKDKLLVKEPSLKTEFKKLYALALQKI